MREPGTGTGTVTVRKSAATGNLERILRRPLEYAIGAVSEVAAITLKRRDR